MNSLEHLKTIAIIPVYLDNDNLKRVLEKFSEKFVDEICLIIDCPNDSANRAFVTPAHIPVHVIRNGVRKGVGYALKQGIRYALDKNYEIALTLAGNNKDDPREIPRLLEPLVKDGCDYVQGSRFLRGGRRVNNPYLRGVFSRLYPFLWTLLTNVKCTDVTNGFRAYKLSLFEDRRINIWQDWLDSYELEYYILYKVLTLGYETTEVPVSKIYSRKHKGGYSKISPFRDWWKIVGPLIYLKIGAKK